MSQDRYIPGENALGDDSPIVKKVKEILTRAWGFRQLVTHNPSPNPVSLEQKHLSLFEHNAMDYVVSEKSDGYRYQLVLGTHNVDERVNVHQNKAHANFKPKQTGFAVMVNRRMQMYEVPLYASADYFKGSVFDGELVLETVGTHQNMGTHQTVGSHQTSVSNQTSVSRQVYLVFDVIMVSGESRRSYQFMERYNEYTKIFDIGDTDMIDLGTLQWDRHAFELADESNKIVSLGNSIALQFRPKSFVTFNNLGSLWRSLGNLKHKSDGLVIEYKPSLVGTGTDHNIMKWKSVHTIDLILEAKYVKGAWTYVLFFQDGKDLVCATDKSVSIGDRVCYLSLKVNDALTNTSVYFANQSCRTHYRLLGEFICEIDPLQPIVWTMLLKWRRDKSNPNNHSVIERSICSIMKSVTINDLLRFADARI